MKKKTLAVLSAVMIMAMSSMTVFAASPTVGTTEVPEAGQTAMTSVEATGTPEEYAAKTAASDGYAVKAVSQQTASAAAVAVQNNVLNHLAAIGNALGNSNVVAAATDSTAVVSAKILSTVDVSATSAAKDANGNYNVTLGNTGISAGDVIVVLHYNGSAWEVIIPTAVADGAIAFTTSSLSPFVIVKLDIAAATMSPQTGDAAPMAIVFIMVGLTGAAICGRKVFA